MLASKYFLRKESAIEKVKREGRLVQSQNFGVCVLDHEEARESKFAFVVSTKISKLAVQRNRIRRALIETIRVNMNKIPEGVDFVFLAKTSIARRSTDEIMKEVEKFLTEKKYILLK